MKNISFFALMLIFGATACRVQKPVSTKLAENNSEYVVSYLFEHDGCKVYRFNDRGNFVYFTSCNGETTHVIPDSIGSKYIKSKNTRQ